MNNNIKFLINHLIIKLKKLKIYKIMQFIDKKKQII